MRVQIVADDMCDAAIVDLRSGNSVITVVRNNRTNVCPECKSNIDIVTIAPNREYSLHWCSCGTVFVMLGNRKRVIYDFESIR